MWTSRERKGFTFERLIHNKLRNNGIASEWRPFQKGADFKIGNIQLEAKFSHAIIFPCWIKRDWVTRFSKDCKVKLVVTNRGMKLPRKSLKILKQHKIRVVFFDKLIITLLGVLSALDYVKVTTFESIRRFMEKNIVYSVIYCLRKALERNQFLQKNKKLKKKSRVRCPKCGSEARFVNALYEWGSFPAQPNSLRRHGMARVESSVSSNTLPLKKKLNPLALVT